MAVACKRSTGAPGDNNDRWQSTNWKAVSIAVRRLQLRIAKAVKEERYAKAKALQWLLTHSYHAKLMAVKRVCTNRGKRTAGVDKVIWSTSRQKVLAVKQLDRRGYQPQPLRRIYIPKKNGRKRPLSIPTMKDRAMQALYKLALDPIAETTADPNSYGFRYYRSCADAMGQCFISLAKSYSPQWILEGDIQGCFDEISQQWLLQNIPMDKQVLRKWLNAGYVEKGRLYPNHKGTPQGGIISPVLANLTLDGLEHTARRAAPSRSKVNVIRYADDFVITAQTKELLENKVKPAIEEFLRKRGLRLSAEKTRITRIEDGFDFLGQNYRKYNGKLLIKPARANVRGFLESVKRTIRKHWSAKTDELIRILNPKIRGWANYHRHVVAGKVFGDVDSCVFRYLWRWMIRKHPNKSKKWLIKKYWTKGSKPWTFSAVANDRSGKKQLFELIAAGSIKILRHVKIRGEVNPFDATYQFYLRQRYARGHLFTRTTDGVRMA